MHRMFVRHFVRSAAHTVAIIVVPPLVNAIAKQAFKVSGRIKTRWHNRNR